MRRAAPGERHAGDELLLPCCEANPRYRDRKELVTLYEDAAKCDSVAGAQ